MPADCSAPTGGDEGRGVAVVTSLRPLDREAEPTRLLPLVVGDARGLTATTTVTVTITDVNDNPMSPGAKVVSVTRITVRVLSLPTIPLCLTYCSTFVISFPFFLDIFFYSTLILFPSLSFYSHSYSYMAYSW